MTKTKKVYVVTDDEGGVEALFSKESYAKKYTQKSGTRYHELTVDKLVRVLTRGLGIWQVTSGGSMPPVTVMVGWASEEQIMGDLVAGPLLLFDTAVTTVVALKEEYAIKRAMEFVAEEKKLPVDYIEKT